MEIGILNILDKKDISAERIVLQVREDCNSWAFILFCNTSKDEGCRKSFIFPNMEIHKGDMITIYSKRGTEKKQKISNGNINHILYLHFLKLFLFLLLLQHLPMIYHLLRIPF